jgi:hypothetical protein
MNTVKYLCVIMAAACLSGCMNYHACRPMAGKNADARRLEVLDRIVIPVLNLTNEPIAQVVSCLVDLSRAHDPQGIGCSIILNLTPRNESPLSNSTQDKGGAVTEPGEKRISINLRNVTFLEAVDAVCVEAGLVWRLDTIVIITPP